MDFWDIFEIFAWGVSALIFLWLIADALRVNREYDEDLLLSSREGSDILDDHGVSSEQGGR